MSQQQQQQVVRQQTSSTVTQQSSSSAQHQTTMQQQSQVQTRVVREVRQGTQMVQGPTQVVQMGLPAGASPPVFEQIFRNARFAQGGDAVFEGKVTGSPRPTVTWVRKGAQLQMGNKYQVTHNPNTGEVTLRIAAIGPGDEGEYTCTASNQYGEAICTVYIQPEAAMMMQQQRQQQQQAKQTFMQQQTMQQQTMQQQTMQQQQQIMQQRTVQQQQSMMQNGQIASFRVDTFEYRLVNEVEFRQAITQRSAGEQDVDFSAPVQGTPLAPQLQQKPRATKVAQGNNATFTAIVSGNPYPRVTWFRNGERLRQSDKYQMSQNGNQVMLVVRNVAPSDNGHYTLLAENPFGATVGSAQLACVPRSDDIINGIQEVRTETMEMQQQVGVEADETGKSMAPKIIRGPTDQAVQEGRMVRFDCRVSGKPYPEVTWLLNGQVITNDARHKILVNEQGNHSLMIEGASVQDSGVLTCIASNKGGEASCQCQLSVIEKEQLVAPKFVERFQQGQVAEGETLLLQVRAVGTPTPQLSWQKDGVSIIPSETIQIVTDGGSSTLQLLSATAADSGWYQCTAQNTAGSTATRARLHVISEKAAPQQPQRPYFPKPVKVIEPEKEPEPEVIYLRHVERAHHQVKSEEEEGPTEPPRFTHPLRDLDIVEGTRAHFEAMLTPVGDPTLQVAWLVDGKPIPASSRATATYRFGYVALDILSVTKADCGVYSCRAVNVLGHDEVTAKLNVRERPQIESTTQHPEALEQIGFLEDSSRYQRTTSIDEHSNVAPTFVKPLVNLGDVNEGKYAHFEAQLHPVSDPFMRIDWFKDGKPITASSRINVIYNFGYVALNIMHLRAEDSGVYTVRAVNRVGEASCQASINVIAFGSVTGDLGIPEQQQHIKSVEEMEAYRLAMQQRAQQELLEASTAPVFKTEPKDSTAREGGYAHFEARLEPIGDPTLKIEWLKDGRPMEASSRITSFFNFGYVALTIKALILKDQGTYTCRAFNSKGEAQVSCKLTMLSKTDEVETQYEQTAMKMQFLEDAARYKRTETEETTVSTMPPKFLGPLKGTNKILEGQKAHFEVRLEPQSDSSMVIEWYFNGQVIMSANRIKFFNDFGYVALDISDVRSTDSGTYTVVARNSLGQDQASSSMVVEARSGIDYSSMHEVTLDKTRALERRHQEPQYDIEEVSKSKPVFTQTLSDLQPLQEGKNIHLEARLEPVGDPTMKVEWFLNGKSVTIGSRFKTYFDFGYVALDVIGAYAIDSGEYTCRATNHLGSAHTSACVTVLATGDIQTDTMHDDAMEQINFLEHGRQMRTATEETDINQPPTFTKSLKNIETYEGTNIHLEARLQPVGDSSMRIDWFFNDEPLKVGHRFRPAYDFDYVALDLLSVYPVDSGIYTCRATNKLGQTVTSASVKVTAKKDLIFDSEHPESLQKLQYLDDASRYQRREIMEEVSVKIQPKFLTQLKELNLMEGQTAHFEAKLEPITDPNMKVEWFKDGRALAEGSRFRHIHDFGYVALDIRGLVPADAGTYTCVATNMLGKDQISTTMKVQSSSNIIMETQQENLSLQQLQMLEDKSRYMRSEQIDETTKQTPVFTTSLKNVEVIEGDRAHFEARLIPASDPTMKVVWYHNGVELKSGSRFMTYNDFGYVALDIMYAYAEDSGTYTCVATNAIGQAITECTLQCHSKDSILLDTMNQEAMSKINRLESRTTRTTVVEEFTSQPPVFTSPLKDRQLTENAPLHFEARLIPVGDPDLKVEWFKNGVPLQQANRISTMHDFGYVALDMKYVNPEDSGTYTCRATNRLGQAVSSASLVVTSKASLLLETEHGEAMRKLRMLEDSSRYTKTTVEETVITQAPNFVVRLSGMTNLWEGQSAHVECRLEPYPDPSMKVEWFHNGKPLQVGSRFRTIYDFGFCALDLLQAVAEDTGTYEVRATNKIGTASSTIEITVKPKSDFIVDTVHPDALPKLARLEQKGARKAEEEQLTIEKPNFGRSLRNQDRLVEGQAVHMEATLTPVNDPTMKVEWFFNGNPIPSGHRFRTTYDFGFVALDILYAYPEDSGTYMCRATNAAGQAVTSCSISVEGTGSMVTDTLDEQRMKKIRLLERSEMRRQESTEQAFQKPVFTTALQSVDGVSEGERVHLECRLEPINDPNLRVEWFVNGVEIKAGHRFRTTHDFGYVALDVLYAYGEDSGTYLCKATNKVGEAVNSCSVNVTAHRSIYMDSQNPSGWEKIKNLEQRSRYERLDVADLPNQPPRFTSELRGVTSLAEGQRAHMEGRIEPIHDPSMRVEWYHNGKILQSAARFHTTFDFGYVALDISSVYEEDSGVYTCRVFNNLGEATSSITFKIEGKSGVIYESAHPEGLEKIREMEDHSRMQRRAAEEVKTFQRPVFTQPLQNLDNLSEGETAHFECRLIPVGDPKLKVEWYRNEVLIEKSSRINTTHDFGYVSMDITGVRGDDEGIYICRAHNDLGEAVTTASMSIKTHGTIQLDSHHPEGMKKIAALESRKTAERGPEEDKVYDKPVFTSNLVGPAQLMEGQSAHYECRVVPIGDPTMKYEWFCNGVSLKMGSRFQTSHDFGFVTLDVLQVIPEDSGVYMCKAYNAAGEAVSSCTTRVIGRDSIIGDAAHPEGWEKIRLREAQWNRVPQAPQTPDAAEPPLFTKNLDSHEKLMEGGSVHLEAQVQPSHDPHLSIEWFKNGAPLATGTRIRSTFDFGHVTLDISGLRESDCGIYTCRAVNRVGEAVSTCTLKVFDRDWLLGESVHPDALPKLARLEQPKGSVKSPDEPTYDVPMFITHLNNVECNESETAHFECRVEPSKDPTMKIEWFINGKPMQAASRYHATYDFGYISLDCTHCYAEDSGVYMCRATNCKGSATTTGTLKCLSKANLYFDTQHPQGQAGLEKVEEAERAFWSKYQRQESEKEISYPKPVFIRPLQPNFAIVENELLHMEANVEPKNDPNLRIEWFLNGQALGEASRFKTSYDFGLVTLDLKDCNERDQGIYTCRAYNKVGEAFTTSTVVVTTKDTLIEGTQHPAGELGLEAILRMEESLRRHDRMLPDEEGHPPVFTTEFKSLSNIEEGEIAHFEAMLTPVGDQTMRVEWFYKGEALKASSRVRTVYAFGMVVLEIVGTKISDSGEYTCKAHNKWGKAECSLNLEVVDRAHGQPPKFTTHIQSLDNLPDGASAHFECTLIPIGDPNMKVEWFHNGQPIRNATRIKTVSDFGFVVLDIAYLRDHDTGEWVCKASNKYGEDYTRATINYRGKGGVYTDSLQPQSLDRIAELEAGKMKASADLSPAAAEPPKFITHITNIDQLVEGQSAHFEARLKPVGDPNLTVEWYKDGKKLPSGHRYRTFHDFGIVILDILYCYEEDSGVYEARAVNKLGEDKTTATLKCSSKTGLILTPQVPRGMEGGLDKIQHMEDTAWMRKDSVTAEKVGMPPKFTVPLSNIESLKEGENAHFEARIVPTDDPRLKVEWYWNGKPMKHSSRIRQFCDFGFVIMELSPVYPEDSGEYMCRAYNDYGEAVTKATLNCDGKRSIILESQLPKSMQRGMEKIAELEGLMIKSPDMPTPSDIGQPPQFITEPKDQSISENQLAHFECRLLPVGDPNLRVDWFHNGRPLGAGTRIKTINDFGYVILEMSGCYSRDAGTYVCRAVNKHGEASVQCKLEVTSKGGINFEPQATSQFKDCTESIQKLEQSMWKKEDLKFDEEKGAPPRFVTNLENVSDIFEGQSAHFDCRVEPVGDPSMRIEWFHNGVPLAAGSRIHMMDDFGFVVLDLEWTFARDSGEYLCRATNKYGQATTTATLQVKSKHNVDMNTQLPKGMTAEKLKELERGPLTERYDPDAELTPPKFVLHIKDAKLEEGESAFFEARVEPRNDPNLRVEWYFNGKPLQSGHRFRTSFEMGHVTFALLHTYAEDSGEYVCRAVNKLGQDITKATLKSRAAQSVVMQSQVPKGMKRMDFATQMEETLKKYCKEVYLTQEDIYEPEKRQPPRFVTQIKDMLELQEMQEAKFECQLAPVGDPNMKVEWFFNGRPLPYKNRFTPIYDFGYVAMVMGWVFAEDSGEYLCRATNLYGQDETRAVIRSTSRPGVIYDSQIPKGMQSLEKIRELESSWQIHPEKFIEEEKVRTKPEILRAPVSLAVQEGEWARFSVRISGYPKPRVMWIVNGSTAMSGNRFKIWYDGMFHLDIPKTRQYDNGKVEVIARNALGEAYSSCELKVNPRQDDYRAVLKNSPKQHSEGTSSSYRKPEWVTRMEELKTAMQAEHVEPQFVQELVNGRVKEMENYVFTVSFVGNPKPEITWYHDNLLIHQQQAFQMRVRGDKAYLTLVEASPKHKGEYVCRAVNAAGEAYTKANLEVIELTYEEKLTIANERYAALNIQHAAQHMKVKERERSEKEKQALKEALQKMKEERQKALIEKERELEEAKQSTWKPHRRLSEAPVVKEVEPQTPKEYRIDQVYTNWKAPIAIEESYPEIVPEEFSPSQIPGVKCFVRVSDTSIRGEEVVKEIAPKFFEDEQVIIELARVHTLLRNSVRVNEIWSMFRAGEFPALQQPSIQTALVKICEYIGHQRNVSLVLAEETKMQASQHPVGLKAFLRMLKHANNVRQDILFKEVIPREMGKWSTTTQELEKVSQMLNQGIETEEIIACCVAGQLPQLKKPETQQPLVNIVEKQGHSVMVAQVLVEEAYRDAKEERALAEHAWQVYHEEELAHAAVSQVEKEEKTAEEFVGDQSVQLQSVEAQRSIQQTVLETSQRVQQVQQVAQSKVQVSVEEGTALQIREAPKQDVTVREEVSQLQQVTSEQPMLMMKESQSMTSQRSESVQMMSQSVTQQQASFSQQESVMNQSIIQQTEVQKSPTVIRKVKKIIKKPKKQSVETVTTETVQEVVQEPQVIEEVTPEQPKVTETVIEEVVQPVGKETTTVTEVAQQPQVYHEESTVERLITDVKQEEQVEVKPTKVVKKKVIKKIVKKPSTEERVEVQREVEDQRTLTIEETPPAEPAIADTVPETPLDTHITEVVQTQTAPAQETTTTVHRVKKIIKKKKRQEVKAEETVEEVPAEPEPIPEPLPEELPEELPEKVPEEIPEKVPEQVPEKVPEQIPEQLPEELPEQLPEQLPEEVPAPQPIEEPVKPEPQVETVHTEVIQPEPASVEKRTVKTTKKIIKKKKRVEVETAEVPEEPAPVPEPIPEVLPEPVPEPLPEVLPEPVPEPLPEALPEPVPEPLPEALPEALPEPIPEEIVQPAPVQETVKITKKIIKKKKRTEVQVTEAQQEPTTVIEEISSVPDTVMETIEPAKLAPIEPITADTQEEPQLETHVTEIVSAKTEPTPIPEQVFTIPEAMPEELPAPEKTVETTTIETREEPVLEVQRTETVQIDTAPVQETVQTTKKVIKKKKKTVQVTEETQEPTPKPEQVAAVPEVAPQEVVQPIEIAPVEPAKVEVREEPALVTQTTEIVQIDTAPVQETVQITKKVVKKEKRTKVQATEVVEEQAPVPEPAPVIPESVPEEIVEPAPIAPIEPTKAEPLEEPTLVTHKTEIVQIDEAPVSESVTIQRTKKVIKKKKRAEVQVTEVSEALTKEMAPGVKAYVEMAEAEKVAIEEIVEKSEVEAEVKKDMRKVGQMVKQGVPSSEVLDLFEAGEFPALRKVEAQAQLLNVVEERGFTAIVNKVTVDEAMQKTEKAIGAKAFVKMMEEAKVDIQEIMTETLPKEFGPDNQKPLEEVAKVSLMIKEGVQAEEIIDMMEANKLPALKKPESQAPLLKVVEQQGQRALVCQVLIEESVKDIKQGLPKVDMASVSSVQSSLTTASASEIVVKEDTGVAVSSSITIQAARAEEVNVGDMLRAIATYVAEEEHENSMHLVEGERVYVIENSDHDWWFVEKHLTKERGYVPSKMLSVDADYTLYVRKRLEEKISNLPVFEKLKKGQKAEAPKITLMLESQSVADGQEAQFVVKVQGTPRPNVTWFRQTAIIKPSEEFQVFYSDDNTATLLIKEVFPEDAGLFTCVVKNLAGYATSEAELVVEGPMSDHGSDTMLASRRSLSRDSSVCDTMEGIPPTFAMKTIRKTCEENAQFEVDVRLVAIPEPEIVWKKDGLILRDSNRIRIVRQKDVHAYRSIILIKGTKKDDEGEYQVYCKNREGEAKCSIFLTITAPEEPVFEELFSDTTVEELGTFRLVARIRGIPTPEVTWSRNGKKIKLEGNVIASYEDEVAVLEVQHASKSDAGKYVCTATNKMGKVSHSANVTVGSDVVTFKRGLESCIVEENSQAVLECRTSKDKEVRWWKGKMEIKTNERITLEHEGLTHRLIIHSSAVSDTGKYKCTFDDQSTWCNMTIKPLEEFAQKLQDVEVLEKDEAVLFVEVSSEKSQVSWHKDGEEIVSGDRLQVIADGRIRRLVISSASLQDEGEYTCVLGDLETTCELSVRELPAEIVKDMTDQTVNKAEKASFAVELSKGDAVVTWFKDGTEIRFSDHYQLSIDGKIQRLLIYNCQNEDAGVYRAVVGKTECSATLKVEGQVEGDFLKKLPPQMDVISTTDAELTVEITKEDRDVTWFRNGEEITVDARFIIKKEKNRRSLVIQNVNLDDTAEYSCVLGSLKTSCRLTVLVLESAPSIDRSSITTEFVVNKGTDVTFTVPFKATPQPTATWSHKGKPIDESKRLVPKISENVATFSIYQVENIDCGEYTLKLVNSCGDVSIDFVLKILDKPSRPGAPEPLKVTDDSVTLHWRAPEDDGGRVIIRYIIEYTFRKETRWEEYRSSEEIRETTVTVTRLTKNEEYSFRVAAVNEVGTSEFSEQSEYIKVAEPIKPEAPEVRELLQPVVTGLRQTIVLRCVITGTPTPDITWTKDGKTITTNLTYENYTATYTIKESNSTTSGTYCCRAENSAGSAETKATVVIQESPQFEFDEKSQAQRLVVGDRWHIPIKVTGFPQPKITWTCNDQPIQAFPRVVVHIEEEDGLTDIAIQKVGREDSAVFSVTAQNSAGRATMSFNLRVDEEEIVEKEVIKERPAAPAGPLEFSEVTTSSARISWQQSPDDGGSEITSYYIEKLEKGQKQWQKVAEVEPNIFTYVVENLNEGREYFFRVFALNAIGLSEALEATETVFIKSPFSPPGPPVGPFDVTDMAETSLVLHWQEPLDDGGSPITGYTVERRTAMKKAWQKIGQTTENVTHFECTNLKKGYTYFFRVFAVNVAGQGPPLQPDEAITAGKKLSVPSKPNGLTVIDVTSKTVTLGWSPPSTTGGADLIGYVIEKRLTESTAEWEKVETVDASVTLYCVENLKEKSEYEFRVFAENPVGLSEEAAVTEYVLLKTHATPPSPPTAPLEARPTGPTSLMIEWGAPESDGGSPLLGYIIAIRDVKRTMWIEVGQVDANFTRLHIKEVQEEHEYNVRVFARNEIGASDPLQTEEPVKIIKPDDFTELPEEDAAPSLSYSTTETLSWMREAGVDADIYSYARGRLLNRDEYFFKVWHQTQQIREESQGEGGEK